MVQTSKETNVVETILQSTHKSVSKLFKTYRKIINPKSHFFKSNTINFTIFGVKGGVGEGLRKQHNINH